MFYFCKNRPYVIINLEKDKKRITLRIQTEHLRINILLRKKKEERIASKELHPWLIGLHVLAPWAFKRHFHFVVFYLLIFISCCDARFEKLQEDAFTYAFILKSLNMIPALGN